MPTPEDTRSTYTLYKVSYTTSGGAVKERSFRSADSMQTFIQSVKSQGGKITGTSEQQEREQTEGFSLFR